MVIERKIVIVKRQNTPTGCTFEKLPNQEGLKVINVENKKAFDRHGIKKGDILINAVAGCGESLSLLEDFETRFQQYKNIQLTVLTTVETEMKMYASPPRNSLEEWDDKSQVAVHYHLIKTESTSIETPNEPHTVHQVLDGMHGNYQPAIEILSEAEQAKRRRHHRRANETPEQTEQRLRAQAERVRRRRANETPSETERRRKSQAEYNRQRLANETPYEKERRLREQAERIRQRRARENPTVTESRLRKQAERIRLRRAKARLGDEAEQSGHCRRRQQAELEKLQRTNETPTQTAHRRREQAGRRLREQTERGNRDLQPIKTEPDPSEISDRQHACSSSNQIQFPEIPSTSLAYHPLYKHGICIWPSCDTPCSSFLSFTHHLNAVHKLDDRSTAQYRVQTQVVEHLENQLKKERLRLQSMGHQLGIDESVTPKNCDSVQLVNTETSNLQGTSIQDESFTNDIDDELLVSPSESKSSAKEFTISASNVTKPIHKYVHDERLADELTASREFYRINAVRPKYTYASLILQAIMESNGKQLTLNEIYAWFQDTFAYYRLMTSASWKNTVRHNLSLYNLFTRVESEKGLKGTAWTVNETEWELSKRQSQRSSDTAGSNESNNVSLVQAPMSNQIEATEEYNNDSFEYNYSSADDLSSLSAWTVTTDGRNIKEESINANSSHENINMSVDIEMDRKDNIHLFESLCHHKQAEKRSRNHFNETPDEETELPLFERHKQSIHYRPHEQTELEKLQRTRETPTQIVDCRREYADCRRREQAKQWNQLEPDPSELSVR